MQLINKNYNLKMDNQQIYHQFNDLNMPYSDDKIFSIQNSNIFTGRQTIFAVYQKPEYQSTNYWLCHQACKQFQRTINQNQFPAFLACITGQIYSLQDLKKQIKELRNNYRNGQNRKIRKKGSSLAPYLCSCGKRFWYKSGLYKHQKKMQCLKQIDKSENVISLSVSHNYTKEQKQMSSTISVLNQQQKQVMTLFKKDLSNFFIKNGYDD